MRAINKTTAAAAAGTLAAGLIAREILKRRREAELDGKTVLITGGSRGLGLSLARAFGSQRCRIAICARDGAELDRAREDLERRGVEVAAVSCDVASREQVDRMIRSVLDRFGRIDVLVNNAGVIQVGPVESMAIEDFENAMNVMFWGTVYPTMALLPHLLARREGRIVNITSIGGKVSVPHLVPYACAKFAAVGFSEGMRAELAAQGIRVVTIAPGLMRTGSYLNAFFKGDQEKESAWFGVGASLPLLTMSGDRAARQIVRATRRGESERVLTLPASLLARFHGAFPGATSTMLELVNRFLLPEPKNGGQARRGSEIPSMESPVIRALTWLGRNAARHYLQPQAVGR